MNIWAALGFIALGALIAEGYNYRIRSELLRGLKSGLEIGGIRRNIPYAQTRLSDGSGSGYTYFSEVRRVRRPK